MCSGEFLGGALHVAAQIFDVVVELLVHRVLTLVVLKVGVSLELGVELLGVGRGALHANLKAMVLDDAGEVRGFALLTQELAHSFFYFRAQGVKLFLTLVHAQLSGKHLVDDRQINLYCHKCKS